MELQRQWQWYTTCEGDIDPGDALRAGGIVVEDQQPTVGGRGGGHGGFPVGADVPSGTMTGRRLERGRTRDADETAHLAPGEACGAGPISARSWVIFA